MGKTQQLGMYPNIGISSSGTPTTNYLPKFTGASTIGNSGIIDNGTSISIDTNNIALTQKNAAGTGTVGLLRVNSSNKIEIGDGGTINPAAIVIPTGSVGIGTTSPSTLLHLSGIDSTLTIQGTRGTGGTHTIGASGANNTNLSIVASSGMYLTTNGVDRLVITSSGNVGIGTSSPAAKLEIAKAGTSFGVPSSAGLSISSGGGVGEYNQILLGYSAGDVSPAVIGYVTTDGAGSTKGALVFGTRDVTTASAPTERMRITAAGEVGIGFYDAGVSLMIQSKSATSSTYIIYGRNSTPTGQFYVRSDAYGFLNNSAWAYGSDRRLKENISYLTESGLQKILKLKPARFDYIDGTKNNIGWIAQDVQEVIEEAVNISNEETGMLALKSDYIVPYLVKAIQELSQEVNELKAKLA